MTLHRKFTHSILISDTRTQSGKSPRVGTRLSVVTRYHSEQLRPVKGAGPQDDQESLNTVKVAIHDGHCIAEPFGAIRFPEHVC
jgi:hypothetical protein